MPSQLSPPPLPQSAPPTPRQPTLYWPTVYVAGAWALLLVAGTTVIVWAGSRPTRLVKVSVPAETPTTAAVRPPEPVPVAAVPAEPSLLPVAEPAPLPVDEPVRRPLVEAPARADADTYGTAVRFLNNPAEAARQAVWEKKLLFVLHLSGNLEDKQFT